MQFWLDIPDPTGCHALLASFSTKSSSAVGINQTNVILKPTICFAGRAIYNNTQLMRTINHESIVNFVISLLKCHRNFQTVSLTKRTRNTSCESYTLNVVNLNLPRKLHGVQGLIFRTTIALIIHYITKCLSKIRSSVLRIQLSQDT